VLSGFSGFQSNSLHFLVHQLHEFLFATGSDPFAHRIIIVPNQTLKSWLQLQLADIGGIVAALEIYTERAAISHILSLSSNQTKFFIPTRLNLSFVIEKLISETQDTQLLQLIDGTPSKRKKRVRLLADELAALFDSYSVYGGKVTQSWSAQEGWQQALWQELYKQYPDWITVSHACSSDLKFSSGRPIFIAVFGLNFILPPLHRLLVDCSKKISINYFLPCPCQQFHGRPQLSSS
jgi:exonuclease V gamma subunit